MQLPAREERFGEAPVEDTDKMADAIASAIEAEGWERIALVGYSFGALLAFEVARRLESRGLMPECVIACARAAPQTAPIASAADLPEEEFLSYVRSLGGLPQEIEEAPELLQLVIPTIRADFRANDNYASAPNNRISAPIAVLTGDADPATADGLADGWAGRTNGAHHGYSLQGGHFFIRTAESDTFATLKDALAKSTESRSLE